MSRYRILAILIFVYASFSEGQDCVDYADYMHWASEIGTAGEARETVARDGILYVREKSARLTALDIADPLRPLELGAVEWSGSFNGLALQGDYAYIADYQNDFMVCDISDPGDMSIVASLACAGRGYGVAVAGDHAYLAAGSEGLFVYDITDPEAPMQVGQLITGGYAYGVVVDGDMVYLADGYQGLRLIDVSTPESPQLLRTLVPIGSSNGVTLQDDLAFVTTTHQGLYIIEVADPLSASILSNHPVDGQCWSVSVNGDLAALANLDEELILLDISDPAAPVQRVMLETREPTWGVTLSDGIMFVALGEEGVISAVLNSTALPAEEIVDIEYHYARIRSDDDLLAYAVSYYGSILKLYDNTDPIHPLFLGETEFPELEYNEIYEMTWNNTSLFAACEAAGLIQFDIYPRHSVHLESIISDMAMATDVVIDDTHIYVATATDGVWIGEMPDGTNGVQHPELGQVYRIELVDSYLYLMRSDGNALVLDVGDPAEPVIVNEFPNAIDRMRLDGDIAACNAWVAGEPEKQIYDLSDPASPQLLYTLNLPLSSSIWRIAGDIVYTTSQYGIQVIDISDPVLPAMIGGLPRGSGFSVADYSTDLPYLLFYDGATSALAIMPPQCIPTSAIEMPLSASVLTVEAWPNPFNPRVTLSFDLAETTSYSLAIFDAAGRQVRNLDRGVGDAGRHDVVWNGLDDTGHEAPSGVYFARLLAGSRTGASKITLAR